MPTGKLFENLKEPQRKPDQKDARIEIAQDFDRLESESIAFFVYKKRLENMKDEAMLQIMATCGEPSAVYWKGRMSVIDEIQGIPEEYQRKAVAAVEEQKVRIVF